MSLDVMEEKVYMDNKMELITKCNQVSLRIAHSLATVVVQVVI